MNNSYNLSLLTLSASGGITAFVVSRNGIVVNNTKINVDKKYFT